MGKNWTLHMKNDSYIFVKITLTIQQFTSFDTNNLTNDVTKLMFNLTGVSKPTVKGLYPSQDVCVTF